MLYKHGKKLHVPETPVCLGEIRLTPRLRLILFEGLHPGRAGGAAGLRQGPAQGLLRGGAGRSSGALQRGPGPRPENRQVKN